MQFICKETKQRIRVVRIEFTRPVMIYGQIYNRKEIGPMRWWTPDQVEVRFQEISNRIHKDHKFKRWLEGYDCNQEALIFRAQKEVFDRLKKAEIWLRVSDENLIHGLEDEAK